MTTEKWNGTPIIPLPRTMPLCGMPSGSICPYSGSARRSWNGAAPSWSICAPLRGDVTNNVEFARQKAQEVFAEGNIPICPHLLFPPVADPTNPAQDEKARAMGLRLLESCQQMNVYGPVWTDGMWQEIYKAGELGIPVMTDQTTIGRTPPARHPKRKER